jgi:hypothetical protein
MNETRWISLTVLALVGAACPLDPKTVGQDEGANDGEGDGDGEDGSADDDASDDAADDAATDGDGDGDDGADDGGVWDDCADQTCGSFCHVCDPEDPECAEPGTFTVCMPDGSCEAWPSFDENPCPGVGVEPGVEDDLSNVGGCADMTVYATDPEHTVALHVRVAGIVEEAEASGAAVVREYAADDPELVLELTFGSNLLAETCTDFVDEPPMIAETWRPNPPEGATDAGTVTITVEMVPGELEDEPRADVVLEGVNFRRADFDGLDPDIAVDSFTVTDVLVGWLPG